MNRILSLALILVSFLFHAQASSLDEIKQNLHNHNINIEHYNKLLGKPLLTWRNFSATDKRLVIRGTIIGLDMETFEDHNTFDKHVSAAIQCMNTGGHGIRRLSSNEIMIGTMECAAKTYRKYCTICKP